MSETMEQFRAKILCPYCGEEHEDVLDMGLNPFLCEKCRKLSVVAIKMVPALSYFVEAKELNPTEATLGNPPLPSFTKEGEIGEGGMTPEEMKAEIRKMQEEIADEEGEILRSAQNDEEGAQKGGEGVQDAGDTEEGGSPEAAAELYDLTNGGEGDCHGADAPRSDEGGDSSDVPENDFDDCEGGGKEGNGCTARDAKKDGKKYGHLPVAEQEMQKVVFSFDGVVNNMELSRKGYPWKSSVLTKLAAMRKKKEKVWEEKVKTVLISIDGTEYNEEVK